MDGIKRVSGAVSDFGIGEEADKNAKMEPFFTIISS